MPGMREEARGRLVGIYFSAGGYLVSFTYYFSSMTGAPKLAVISSMLRSSSRTLLASKVLAFRRRMISFMRGCSHFPGVPTGVRSMVAGEAVVALDFCGVRFSRGRTEVAVAAIGDDLAAEAALERVLDGLWRRDEAVLVRERVDEDRERLLSLPVLLLPEGTRMREVVDVDMIALVVVVVFVSA